MLEPMRKYGEALEAGLLNEIEQLLQENLQLKVDNMKLLGQIHRIREAGPPERKLTRVAA